MGNITGRSTIGVSQVTNAGTTSNDADEEIDLALTDNLTVLVDNTNVATITDVAATYDFSRNILFVLADGAPAPTALVAVTIPATKRGQFVVKNTLSFDATVGISGQSEALDTVAAGTSSVFSSDGVNCRIAGGGGGGGAADFLSLTDTPGSYTGGALRYLRVNAGETAVEVGTAAPVVTVTPPFRGCLINRVANQTAANYSVGSFIPFDDEVYDTDGFHDNATNNSRITIPSGLGITKVRLSYRVIVSSLNSADATRAHVFKNGAGSLVGGGSFMSEISTTIDLSSTSSTAVLDVVDGDYFEVWLDTEGDTSITVDMLSWFSLEIIETDENAFPPEPIDHFVHGAPAVSDDLFMKVATRRFTVADALAGSQAYATGGANGGIVVYDVERNGTKIGDITFANTTGAAAAGTFATVAAQEYIFAVGDRLEIVSPANIQSMTDIAFNLWAWRS